MSAGRCLVIWLVLGATGCGATAGETAARRRIAVPFLSQIEVPVQGLRNERNEYVTPEGGPDLAFCAAHCGFAVRAPERLAGCWYAGASEEITRRIGSSEPGAIVCLAR